MGQPSTGPVRGRGRPARRAACRGFTLTELLVVIVIIGIIIVFILLAAFDARRRAEESATLALITKLETGLNDRLNALLQYRPDPSAGHNALSTIYYNNGGTPVSLPSAQRAQVWAWYDYIKREVPDVFFVQNFSPGSQDYPLNFAANPYPDPNPGNATYSPWVLPMGAGTAFPPSLNGSPIFSPGEGIYGASYMAAAGIYKNLGYLPTGYDGVDNDFDGLIDNWGEGVNSTNQASVLANLQAHQHHTARAEVLYAVLVEGIGPLGSVFTGDEFTDREVQDTDGDGLPEFVDAWGQPLQFFRWPILYQSEMQLGQVIVEDPTTGVPTLTAPYATVFELREQSPLDPNQQLMAPAWWSSNVNNQQPNWLQFSGPAGTVGGSHGVIAFEAYFHRLTEPYTNPGNAPQFYWDRGAIYPYRRAFFSKPLIISSGPDKQLGLFLYPDGFDSSPPANPATHLIMNENVGMRFLHDFTTSYLISAPSTITPDAGDSSYDTNSVNSSALWEASQDDISNHYRGTLGGPGGS
jgi:prepilin-type N-terminal cleavage/methylation domain-containing protein